VRGIGEMVLRVRIPKKCWNWSHKPRMTGESTYETRCRSGAHGPDRSERATYETGSTFRHFTLKTLQRPGYPRAGSTCPATRTSTRPRSEFTLDYRRAHLEKATVSTASMSIFPQMSGCAASSGSSCKGRRRPPPHSLAPIFYTPNPKSCTLPYFVNFHHLPKVTTADNYPLTRRESWQFFRQNLLF
jgi:hypothetical protein